MPRIPDAVFVLVRDTNGDPVHADVINLAGTEAAAATNWLAAYTGPPLDDRDTVALSNAAGGIFYDCTVLSLRPHPRPTHPEPPP